MDAELQNLSLQLADVAVRHTAGRIADRIQTVRSKKKDQETIAELEQIVNDLQSDRAELVRIAQAFEEEMVAQRIAPKDVEYITKNIVPVLTRLLEFGAAEDGSDPSEVEAMLNIVKPIVSVETVTVLQLVGFNFKEAVGGPLTELVRCLILSKAQPEAGVSAELQLLAGRQQVAYWEALANPEVAAALAMSRGAGNEGDADPDA